MSEQTQWVAHLDRNFSWITVDEKKGLDLPPVVVRDLSEENCASIVNAHNEQHALEALANAASDAITVGQIVGYSKRRVNVTLAALAKLREGK